MTTHQELDLRSTLPLVGFEVKGQLAVGRLEVALVAASGSVAVKDRGPSLLSCSVQEAAANPKRTANTRVLLIQPKGFISPPYSCWLHAPQSRGCLALILLNHGYGSSSPESFSSLESGRKADATRKSRGRGRPTAGKN